MGEESRIRAKRERRRPVFLADFVTDKKIKKLVKNPTAASTPAASAIKPRNRLQTFLTKSSIKSKFRKEATLKKVVRLDNNNGGSKGSDSGKYDAVEHNYASSQSCPREDSETESDYEMEFYRKRDLQTRVTLPDMCCPFPSQDSETESEYEMEFFTKHGIQTEVPLPTLSHMDMCRSPYEDPEYQRLLVASYRRELMPTLKNEKAPPSISVPVSHTKTYSQYTEQRRLTAGVGSSRILKVFSLSQHKMWCKTPTQNFISKHRTSTAERPPRKHGRRGSSDGKKCRKVYGMERRDLWCTQCKWKKACTRFGDDQDLIEERSVTTS